MTAYIEDRVTALESKVSDQGTRLGNVETELNYRRDTYSYSYPPNLYAERELEHLYGIRLRSPGEAAQIILNLKRDNAQLRYQCEHYAYIPLVDKPKRKR